MNIIETSLPGVLIIEPKVFGDERGFFYESFNARAFEEATGLKRNFVQDNHSRSQRACCVACITSLSTPRANWCASPTVKCWT